MHMADSLISPVVGGVMCAVSAGALAYSVYKLRRDGNDEEKSIPMTGVMGAFVFAAQMINFTIPATGSSGHIGGGIMLAALLGGPCALLTITSVLVIQALFFADGGLLALGCNIFNLGVIPCLIVYPLIFKPLTAKKTRTRLFIASLVSCVISLQLGALSVVAETLLSGITALPAGAFLALMQPIHLAIGAVEGVITGAVAVFVFRMRPELFNAGGNARVGKQTLVAIFLALSLVIGGGVSLFASQNPDGLEWASEKVLTAPLPAAESEITQEKIGILPGYGETPAQGSAAGIIGSVLTLVLCVGAGGIIYIAKRRKHG